jgi:flagellar hook assembly protein FlgD
VVSIDVLDISGALVRRLISGVHMPAGNHTVDWQGRNNDGRPVAAGVYLVRMRAAGIEQTKAVTLLK